MSNAMLILAGTLALGQVDAASTTPIGAKLAEPATRIAKAADGRGVLVLTVTAADTENESWGIVGVVHDVLVRQLTEASAKVLVSPRLDTITGFRRITGPLDEKDLERIRSEARADLLAVAIYRRSGNERTIDLKLQQHDDGALVREETVSLDEGEVDMAANIPLMNRKVFELCSKNFGRKVGDGSGLDLAVEALDEAGAHRTGKYIFGRKLGELDSPLPGDIIRIEGARFRGRGKWRTIGSGTEIIEAVHGPTVVTVLHQKDKKVERTTLFLHEKRDGFLEIYRPRPKVLKAVEPAGDDESGNVTAAVDVPIAKGVTLSLRPIDAGRFRMGRVLVTLSRPFHLGITEVTQAQWKAVMGDNPSVIKGDELPVTNVSWNDIQSFLKKLDASPAGQSFNFRLPTSAEWEYACRARTQFRYSFGDDALDLVEHGWFVDNAKGGPNPVAQLRANKWGLYDMHGNVWEFVQDVYEKHPFGDPPRDATDPMGPTTGKSRVMRGGGFSSAADNLSAGNRGYIGAATGSEKTGFRIAADAK